MEIHLKTIGCLLIVLAFVHIIFPKYFDWDKELKSLSLINRQMIRVHTFFIALTIFLMGVLCLTSATEIIETKLGQKLALGLGIFWGLRLFIQFFGYAKELWKGKLFETSVHIVFSILWLYLTVIFLKIYFSEYLSNF